MTPAQVRRGHRLYRYYTCSAAQRQGWHTCPSKALPAATIERYVIEEIADRIPDSRDRTSLHPNAGSSDPRQRLRERVARIEYDGTTGEVAITLNAAAPHRKAIA
jgi:hypothetical protein